MENDDEMLRIIQPLFSDFLKHVGVNTTTPDLFVPLGHQTMEFFQKISSVLIEKKSFILERWQHFFENCCINSLSTHEMYLRYVMFACETQASFSDNIFDKILDTFALVVNFNIETLLNSWINFCELSVDIFMVFYKSTLKELFYKHGGFEQCAEYLRICNGYLASENSNPNDLEVSTVHATNKNSILENLHDKTEKEIEALNDDNAFITEYDVIDNTKCKFLAKAVLSTTKIKLPTLPDSKDLKFRVQAALQQKALMYERFSERERNHRISKDETTNTGTRHHETTAKRKMAESASTDETPERHWKRNAVDIDCEPEITTAMSILGTTRKFGEKFGETTNEHRLVEIERDTPHIQQFEMFRSSSCE